MRGTWLGVVAAMALPAVVGAQIMSQPRALEATVVTPRLGSASSLLMTVTGATQGRFRGDEPRKGYEDAMEVVSIGGGVGAFGAPTTGARQHRPLVVRKAWSPATPQFLTAIAHNEKLASVAFDCWVTDAMARSSLAYTVKLTDAHVLDIRWYTATGTGAELPNGTLMEEITLWYQKIELTATNGKVSAMDER
ncbi:MAG: type VI secretion system tube protein TssD [Armatimonadia bacterium]